MRRALSSVARRRRRLLLGGEAEAAISEALSTFTAAAFRWDGDGVATNALTFTARDTNGDPIPDLPWTATITQVAVGAAESSVTASPDEIEDNDTDSATCLLYLRDDDSYPMAGVPAALCVLAVPGAGNTVTQPASATSATGQASGSFTADTPGTMTASYTALTQAITQTAEVEVTGDAPEAPALVFASRWNDSTGTGGTALRDGTTWSSAFGSGGNSGVETLASLSLTEPSELSTVDNAYVIRAVGTDWSDTCIVEYDAGAPGDGDVRYHRMYNAMLVPDAVGAASRGNLEHGSESAETGGGDGWNVPIRNPRADGTWWPAFRDIASGYRYIADGLSLDKDTFYRFEWALTYGAATYTVAIRIYDASGTLVATEADFYQYTPSDNPSLLLSAASFAYTAAQHRYIRIGNNGPTSNYPGVGGVGTPPTNNDPMHAVTAYAISHTAWCGIYIDGNG